MKTPTSLAETFDMAAALDQESFKVRCAQSNDIAEMICDLLETKEQLRSSGGPRYARAKALLDIARAERRRRNREAVRAA